jgi:acyl-CoA reductase-like NAD-dependent aldehyde dehydrogenase
MLEAETEKLISPHLALVYFVSILKGGTATGRIVARTAAPQFKKLSLELGGKNASIVFADCDFEKTVRGVARAAFFNLGQVRTVVMYVVGHS